MSVLNAKLKSGHENSPLYDAPAIKDRKIICLFQAGQSVRPGFMMKLLMY
jgi:hypothetical protein